MSALLALRLVTYLPVGVGVIALLLAGLLDPLGGVILALALIGRWAIDQIRDRMPVRPAFGWALVTTAAFAIGIDLLYLAQNLLDGMVHLLLFFILSIIRADIFYRARRRTPSCRTIRFKHARQRAPINN